MSLTDGVVDLDACGAHVFFFFFLVHMPAAWPASPPCWPACACATPPIPASAHFFQHVQM
jgi:hypothetical protein